MDEQWNNGNVRPPTCTSGKVPDEKLGLNLERLKSGVMELQPYNLTITSYKTVVGVGNLLPNVLHMQPSTDSGRFITSIVSLLI